MKLNKKQETFVKEASQKLSTEGWWTLHGRAGSGKTYAISKLWESYKDIVFLAPTHKAKNVLQNKLGEDAYVITTTSFTRGFKGTKIERIEKDILTAVSAKDSDRIRTLEKERDKLIKSGEAQQPVFGIKDRNEEEIAWIAVVCDESSMVDLETRNLIIENSDSAIFVGDGFQLPPVVKRHQDQNQQDWFRRNKPTWELETIVRQAQDSGILKLANEIREYGDEEEFPIHSWMRHNEDDWDDLFVLPQSPLCYEQAAGDDTMMLSFLNDVVDEFSFAVRKHLGRDPDVVSVEDKLYCANSFTDDFKNKDEVSLNEPMSLMPSVITHTLNNLGSGSSNQVLINTARLKVGLTLAERRERLSYEGLLLRYDYARTTHSSQGSEWSYVMYRHAGVGMLDTLTHNRLLYTAVTRASKTFILLTS